MTDRVWILLSTFARREDALGVARQLVEERLAACAQVEEAPITSVYRWEGSVHEDPEFLLRLKTSAGTRSAAMARLEELHPYDVAQVVAVEAEASAAYAAWVRRQCGSP